MKKIISIGLLVLFATVLSGCTDEGISLETLKEDVLIASVLSDLDMDPDEISNLKIESTIEDGIEYYEITFDYKGEQIKLEVDPTNAEILENYMDLIEGSIIYEQLQLPVFTIEELLNYSGVDGSTAYIAVDGIVYDVTDEFSNGQHQGMQLGGTDATVAFESSPHSSAFIATLELIGTLEGFELIFIDGEPETPVTNDPEEDEEIEKDEQSSLPVFTLEDLSNYSGTNGTTAYIVVEGIVYDVTDEFNNGQHQGMQLGGTDSTAAFESSPHSSEFISTLEIVGSLEGYDIIFIEVEDENHDEDYDDDMDDEDEDYDDDMDDEDEDYDDDMDDEDEDYDDDMDDEDEEYDDDMDDEDEDYDDDMDDEDEDYDDDMDDEDEDYDDDMDDEDEDYDDDMDNEDEDYDDDMDDEDEDYDDDMDDEDEDHDDDMDEEDEVELEDEEDNEDEEDEGEDDSL